MPLNPLLETPQLIEDADRTLQLLRSVAHTAPTQNNDAEIGEAFAKMAQDCGRVAAAYLFRAQWNYKQPEWYDHRLHLLDPKGNWNDYWTASADNVIRVLPIWGRLLDLCSGDGFYDYWFYRYRGPVVALDNNLEAYEHACKHHAHPHISYLLANVLQYQPTPEFFDVVLIRGAIEHFSREEQQAIFRKAYAALKPGGYFCGDTVAMRATGVAQLDPVFHIQT